MATPPRSWIEVSASAVRHNLRVVHRYIGSTPVMAIVKANAYGHGLKELLHVMRSSRLWGVGVAYDEEALEARKYYQGRILVLSYWHPARLRVLLRARTEITVWDTPSLSAVLRAARSLVPSK